MQRKMEGELTVALSVHWAWCIKQQVKYQKKKTAGRQELNRSGRSGEGAAVRDRQFGSCVSSDLLDREGSSETLVIEMSILGL